MKTYATLLVSNDKYELLDGKRNIILSGEIPEINYICQNSNVFNILSQQGWDIAFTMKNENWFMMSMEDK